ncbi:MAG: hypothetical protein ABIY52_14385 [Gemmatimonadaceae bacterium]
MATRAKYPPLEITSHPELRALAKLKTPKRIQDFLDTLPINHERRGGTQSSPLTVMRRGTAQCMEGALVAALALWMQGQPPLVLDLKSSRDDLDHVVTLFRQDGFWGAISKTNHAVLRYREPIFRDVRELATSYFHEYTLPNGRKTLRSYSLPFDLRTFPKHWMTSPVPLWDLETRIDTCRHVNLLNRRQVARLRVADDIEIQAGRLLEWR